jgi:putative ABC transport system permease protein
MPTLTLGLRWRYAWRDLWKHKTRTLLVILSITVGVFAFGTILGAGNLLRRELRIEYLAIQPASATLHTTPFDHDLVDAIQRMPAVALAEGRTSVVVRFWQGENPSPASKTDATGAWHDLQLYALENYLDNQINMIRPYLGAWPPPEDAILIERNSLFLTQRQVGEPLLIETSDGQPRSLPIAGLAHDMNQPPAQITGIPYAYVTRDTLEWLGLPRRYNQLHLVVASGRFDKAHILQVAQAAADKIERSGYTVFWTEVPEPGQHFVEEFLPTILLILTTLGVMALILSAFLVINVITAIVTQQTRQIGVMKAIGAPTGQITNLYLRMVMTFGVCALLLAVPLGALGAAAFSRFVAGQLNFDLHDFRLTPNVLLIQVTVGLLAPILAALHPILTGSRKTVREAIQDQGLDLSASRSTPADHLLNRLQHLLVLARPVQLSLRNTFRRRGRLARTLIPLALGGAIFMSVLSVRASLFRTLEATLLTQGFDVQIQLDQSYHRPRVVQAAAPVAGVTLLETWTVRQGSPVRGDGSEGDDVRVYAVPPTTAMVQPDLVGGRWLQSTDRNVLVAPISLANSEPTAGLGQELTLRMDGQESTWRVIGVNQVFQPPIAPPVLYVPQDALWGELGGHNQADVLRILTAQHDPATHARVAQALEERLYAASIGIRSTRTASEDRRIFTERFNLITVILMIMAFLLAVVGSLGLMGAMSINVLERKREIGIMRAIGAADSAVIQIFVVEGVVIGVLSWLGALLLSQPISRLMSWRIGLTFAKLPLEYVYDLRAPLLWLAIVVVVAALASLLPARNAANLRVRETVAYE